MSQSTPERQAKWRDDATAISYLKERGFRLLPEWQWLAPIGRTDATEEEADAILYLIEEWDFGGLVPER